MSDFEKQCITLFVNHPLDWRDYLGCFNNPKYADRVISNLIAHDKGIEFEIGPEIYEELKRVYKKSSFRRMTFDNDGTEVQIRINQKSIRAIHDLYRFLSRSFLEDARQVMSGIHIHSDLGKKLTNTEQEYLTVNLDKFVATMANSYFHYEGRYNRNIFSTTKGFSMVYRRSFKTIEYRCIKMTWSLKELLLHLILTEKLTNYIRSTEKPNVDRLFNILDGMISLKKSILKSNEGPNDSVKSVDKLYEVGIDTTNRFMNRSYESHIYSDDEQTLGAQRESQLARFVNRFQPNVSNEWTTFSYNSSSQNTSC